MSLRWLPNFLTLLNLGCGLVVLWAVDTWNLPVLALLILAAALLDLLDGALARLLKSTSPMGAQLDNLADLVSFGLAPAMLLSQYYALLDGKVMLTTYTDAIGWVALALPLAAAWRLARFASGSRSANWFVGLPTPASALLVVVWVVLNDRSAFPYLYSLALPQPPLFALVVLLIAGWMVSPLPVLKPGALKRLQGVHRYMLGAFTAISLVLFIILGLDAVPLLVLGYGLFSLVVRWQGGLPDIPNPAKSHT